MAPSGLFIERSGELVELPEAPVEFEDDLQALVADYPQLLAGDDESVADRRWLLIRREQGIAAAEGEGDRFSLDHLFVDQNGTPTLVEVKRSSDTRARREVVAQMLDYAANARSFLTVAAIRQEFEETHPDPASVIRSALGDNTDPDQLWARLDEKLRAADLRLVFLADEIPDELKTLVEFLNEQMPSIEVVAIEVSTFGTGDCRVLRTRTVGQTQIAKANKNQRRTRRWDRDSWLSSLAENKGAEIAGVAERILAFGDDRKLAEVYGTGVESASVQLGLNNESAYFFPFLFYNVGGAEVSFRNMVTIPYRPFDEMDNRLELRRRLQEIEGIDLAIERIDLRPSFWMEKLIPDEAMNSFLGTFDWALGEAEKAGR